jgi:hypothetical protein
MKELLKESEVNQAEIARLQRMLAALHSLGEGRGESGKGTQ